MARFAIIAPLFWRDSKYCATKKLNLLLLKIINKNRVGEHGVAKGNLFFHSSNHASKRQRDLTLGVVLGDIFKIFCRFFRIPVFEIAKIGYNSSFIAEQGEKCVRMLEHQSLDSLEKVIEDHLRKNTDRKHIDGKVQPQPPKMRWKWPWIASIGVLFALGAFCYFEKQIHKLESKQREARHALRRLKHGVIAKAPMLGGMPIPMQLRNVPFAEADGIVLATQTIQIRNVFAPHNACIFKNENGPGYHLVFRYDQFNSSSFPAPFFSYIGFASLDDKFEQTAEEFRTIDTHSRYSEDPRIVKVGSQYYLSYNDVQPHSHHCRSMRIAHLNLEDCSIKYSTNLDLHLFHVEKNWAPFQYLDENNQPQLMFEYFISPHKILELPDPQVNHFNHLIFSDHPSPPRLPWHETWGHPRGGTPPQRMGEEYLSFFHSSFKDEENVMWYLVGAYTFEAKPPFRITAVSKRPILFDGIYDTPLMNTASPNKRVIFPTGFVMEERNGKQLIQLSCGENDSSVKLVTIDREALLKNMIKCKNQPQ